MADNPDLLKNLYNAFDPFRPLPAGDPTYVDCREVRGDGDILEDLGIRLQRSNQKTCQLYSGHRGAGKSTELLRLKDSLEKQKFYKIREKVNPHTVTLISVLNEFLAEAKNKLPNGCTQLAVIADNLDRIAPIIQEGGKTN